MWRASSRARASWNCPARIICPSSATRRRLLDAVEGFLSDRGRRSSRTACSRPSSAPRRQRADSTPSIDRLQTIVAGEAARFGGTGGAAHGRIAGLRRLRRPGAGHPVRVCDWRRRARGRHAVDRRIPHRRMRPPPRRGERPRRRHRCADRRARPAPATSSSRARSSTSSPDRADLPRSRLAPARRRPARVAGVRRGTAGRAFVARSAVVQLDRLLNGLPLLFDLRAQPIFLRAQFGRELGAEIIGLEHLANLNLRWAVERVGAALDPATASSMDAALISQNPATNSFVSGNGPSITVRWAPEKRTRLPFALECRPSPASITPALTSSSLYLPISASSFSLGITPASDSFVAFTITMKRIVCLLFSSGSSSGPPDCVTAGSADWSNEAARDRHPSSGRSDRGSGVSAVSGRVKPEVVSRSAPRRRLPGRNRPLQTQPLGQHAEAGHPHQQRVGARPGRPRPSTGSSRATTSPSRDRRCRGRRARRSRSVSCRNV